MNTESILKTIFPINVFSFGGNLVTGLNINGHQIRRLDCFVMYSAFYWSFMSSCINKWAPLQCDVMYCHMIAANHRVHRNKCFRGEFRNTFKKLMGCGDYECFVILRACCENKQAPEQHRSSNAPRVNPSDFLQFQIELPCWVVGCDQILFTLPCCVFIAANADFTLWGSKMPLS